MTFRFGGPQLLTLRRKWIALAISAPIAGVIGWCAAPESRGHQALSQEEIESLFLAKRASSDLCEVHGLPLLPDRVGTQYGLLMFDERAASEFPNARVFVLGGCTIPSYGVGTLAYVLYCPACRRKKGKLDEARRRLRQVNRNPMA